VESPAWFVWLDQASSFAFHGRMGSYTARLERKERGGGYWYAYLREHSKVTKRYLGRSADLTLSSYLGYPFHTLAICRLDRGIGFLHIWLI